jgi:uncharacterized membrane protein
MSRYVSYRDFDWVLLGFVLVICALGVVQIHSATEHTKFAGAHIKQIYWILAGVGAMFLVSLLNYQAVLEQIHWMYIAALASLDRGACSSGRNIWERALDQNAGRRPFSALGVGEADPDSGGGEVFCGFA